MKAATGPALWVERGGTGKPLLLVLHGLGANSTVWQRLLPIVEARWHGRWIAPDLRGHGRSGHAAPYGMAMHAADIAGLLDQEDDVVALGHSMGGGVAMTLASGWFGVTIRQVIAFGVKLVWTAEEVAKAQEVARGPVRWFATREEAIERYLRVAGLKGLVDPASAEASVGIVAAEGRFCLAADPRVNGVVGVPLEAVIAAMRAPLHLAAGEHDPMVALAQMRRFDERAMLIAGAGHNPHVEVPEVLWRMVEEALS
jgi:pimeloyl-ACP methyl ester carboxylesterase